MMNNWKAEPSGTRHSRFLVTRHEDGDGLNFAQETKSAGKPAKNDSKKTGVSMVQTITKYGIGRKVAFQDSMSLSVTSENEPTIKPCIH